MDYDINLFPARSGRVIGEDGKVYNIVDLLRSAGGGNSMEFHFGTGAPESSLGSNGDVYLNTSNGDFYKKEDGVWTLKGNLKGPQGEQGPQGPAGRGIENITFNSDSNELVFSMTDSTEIRLPWPEV